VKPYRSILKMKKGLLLAIFIGCSIFSFATHIAGGELFYERVGPGAAANSDRYRITMRLFRQCTSTGGTGALLTVETPKIGIYNTSGLTLFETLNLIAQFTTVPTLQNNPDANPCFTGTQIERTACYEIGTWVGEIDLPKNAGGYTLVWTRYTRRTSENVIIGTNTGGSFVSTIPGTNAIPTGYNNSAQFVVRDTSLVCRGTSFQVNFSAVDPDTPVFGDSLVYHFGDAYDGVGGSSTNPDPFNQTGVPNTISLSTIPYAAPFSSVAPLGSAVTINSSTGIISGVAPPTPGFYVVVVVAEEWRGGVKISEHRKDFTLKVGDCTLAAASLKPSYITCGSFSYSFQNESSSPGITAYAWNFGNPASGVNNSSTSPTPSHTFTDTGKYIVKLFVTSTGGCQDSAQTIMLVYPTFNTDFAYSGNCYQSPFNFTDATTTTYGTVNTWRWNLDIGGTNDTSAVKNPSYLYAAAGPKTVRLISTNDKGCIDTAVKTITVRENPVLNLPFKDTLICDPDYLPLIAQGTGNFSWISLPTDPTLTTPNIANPVVSPDDTTLYVVTLNDNGCIKKDTITVNVLPFITVQLGPDTGICRTDTMMMRTNSHALSYQWFPATGLNSANTKFPIASPDTTTRYFVTANLGQCQDTASVLIRVAPYPQADAGNGATICYGEKIQLHANYVGTGYSWSPTNTLQNPTSLNPFAGPQHTTAYVFTAFSQGICPKPTSDTAYVIVRPQVKAFAGNDTVITALQPLQLNAAGGATYSWTPSFGLSANNIGNPIAILPFTIDSIIYKVRATDSAGCYGDDDIKIIVFKTGPDMFIPTGFTPNGDGKNEIAKPVLVGMRELNYFRIYNRWGQMVYSTSEVGKGWDGTFGGKLQPSGTYVFAAQAVDYTGKTVFKKGTVVLIR
jgi:gliding motility-associated-like protein